jgi:DNA-binding transcriptional regulator YdaS (Cro superfamily)
MESRGDVHLIDLIKEVGSQAKLAEMCGVPQATISYWKVSGKAIPAEIAIQIEKNSGGLIPRWRCRPDLWDAPK